VRSQKARPVPDSAMAVAGLVITLLFCAWIVRSTNSGFEKDSARQDEYFTPRMKAADELLQVLSKRLGAEYVPGIVEWRSFATLGDLASTELNTPNSVWGRGPLVRKMIDGYEIAVTYGVQTFVPHERGGRASWDVFVPRFTVTAAKPRRPLDRFDVFWSSDDEVPGATGRAVDKALSGALSFVGRTLLPMPPDVERAHAVLTMNAAKIWCGKDRIEVTGRPLPRARGETREFGQGDFEVESMLKMVERTLALVRTLENA
jgi:hypothetical protein